MTINTIIDEDRKPGRVAQHHLLPQWFLFASGTLLTLILLLLALVLTEQANGGDRLSQFFGMMTGEQIFAQSRRDLQSDNPIRAIALAKAAVAREPLSQGVLRAYGELLAEAGENERAELAMQRAAELGWRDSKTQLYWLQKDAVQGDLASSYMHADALAKRVGMNEQVFLLFTIYLDDSKIKSQILEDLKKQVIWRGDFFRNAKYANGSAAEAIGDMLIDLTTSNTPPSRSEYIPTVAALIKNNRMKKAAALNTRLSQFDGEKVDESLNDVGFKGTVFGEENTTAGSSPFDWQLFNSRGMTADILPNDRKQWILSLNVQSRSQLLVASKVLVLSPGTYQLSYTIDKVDPDAVALKWVVSCLAPSAEAESNPQVFTERTGNRIAVRFTVNPQCEGQQLRLMVDRTAEAKNIRLSIADMRLRAL